MTTELARRGQTPMHTARVRGRMNSSRRRLLGGVALVVIGAALFTACASTRGGQSARQASENVQGLPGIASATVTSEGGAWSGTKRTWTTAVKITLAEGYRIGDPDSALKWALDTGLSVDDHEPTVGIFVGFYDATGSPVSQDWAASIENLGFDVTSSRIGLEALGLIAFDGKTLGTTGAWPGPVPAPPAGAIVPE